MNNKNLIRKFISNYTKLKSVKSTDLIIKTFIAKENISYQEFLNLSFYYGQEKIELDMVGYITIKTKVSLDEKRILPAKIDTFIALTDYFKNKGIKVKESKFVYENILKSISLLDFFTEEKVRKAFLMLHSLIDLTDVESKHSLDIKFLEGNYRYPLGTNLLHTIVKNIKEEKVYTLKNTCDKIKSIKDHSSDYKEFHFKEYLREIEKEINKKIFITELGGKND